MPLHVVHDDGNTRIVEQVEDGKVVCVSIGPSTEPTSESSPSPSRRLPLFMSIAPMIVVAADLVLHAAR